MAPDEEPFLLALAADPADDLTRLVYADWLEEHADAPRVRYVRLVVALARLPAAEVTESAAHDDMMALAAVVDPDWESRAGKRFEFAVLSCHPADDLLAGAALAELTDGDFDRAVELVRAAPTAATGAVTYREAFWLFSRWQVWTRTHGVRSAAAIRPVASPHPPGTLFDVVLSWLPTDFWYYWAPVYKTPFSALLDLPPREAADRLRRLPAVLRTGLTREELEPAVREVRRALHRDHAWAGRFPAEAIEVIPRPPAPGPDG